MLLHTHVPKSNPVDITIYSASIARCFMLTRSIWHVWVTGKRRDKGISKKAWHAVPAQGHCYTRQFLPKALPGLVFPETVVQECGLQGTRREKTTVTMPFIQRTLTFSHLGVLGQYMTFLPILCIILSFLLHARLFYNCPDPHPQHKEALGPLRSPHFFPSPHRTLKSSLHEQQERAVRSGAPQQAGAVWNGFWWDTAPGTDFTLPTQGG